MEQQFLSIKLEEIGVGETLPVNVYLYLDFRFIAFRGKGDVVLRAAYEKLELKGIKNVFIDQADQETFAAWVQKRKEQTPAPEPVAPEARPLQKAREDLHRKAMDIFQDEHPDK